MHDAKNLRSRHHTPNRLMAIVATALTVCGALLVVLAAQERPADRPDISGNWVLNHEASDRTELPDGGGMRGRGRGDGPPPGGRGGGRGGMGRGAGRGGRDTAEGGDMKSIRDTMEEILTPSERLIVMQRDATHVTFVDADGRSRTYATTNEKEQHQLTSGTVQTRTRWEAGELVMTVAIEKGPTVAQSYRLDVEHRRLLLVSKIDGSRERDAPSRTVVYEEALSQ